MRHICASVCAILLYATTVLAQPACSHYASPNGSGSTCSESAPCNVGTWLTARRCQVACCA